MTNENIREEENKIALDMRGIKAKLSCGSKTAERIGREAGAIIRIGRRKLFMVQKIEDYMNKHAEG